MEEYTLVFYWDKYFLEYFWDIVNIIHNTYTFSQEF